MRTEYQLLYSNGEEWGQRQGMGHEGVSLAHGMESSQEYKEKGRVVGHTDLQELFY